MVVDMGPVRMRRHDEGVLSLCETEGCLIADPVGLLRRNLARLKGLTDLISNDVALIIPPGRHPVLTPHELELFSAGLRVTFIAGNQSALFCLLTVLRVADPLLQALGECLSLVDVKRDEPRCCHIFLLKNKERRLNLCQPTLLTFIIIF